MMTKYPRWMVAGVIAILVIWQAASCCLLERAISPPVTPIAPSSEQAQALRERVMQVKSSPGPFTIEIGDQELTSYVIGLLQSGAGQFPARDMQIAFGEGTVDVWATFIEIAPTDIPAYVRVKVEARDGQLSFVILEANAGRVPVPGAMRESISQSLSETLAELEFGLWIDDVRVEPGVMTFSGRIIGPIPDLP